MIETTEAISLSGIGRKRWAHLMQRRLYTAAPPVTAGRARRFDRDDVVALAVLRVLLIDLKVDAAYACSIASQIRKRLRKSDDIDTLFLAINVDRSGQPRPKIVDSPPGDGRAPFPFRIALYRAQAEADIARIVAGRKAH